MGCIYDWVNKKKIKAVISSTEVCHRSVFLHILSWRKNLQSVALHIQGILNMKPSSEIKAVLCSEFWQSEL